MIEVPEGFARGTVAREGEAGVAWLAELPVIVDELLGRWQCVQDGEVMHGEVGIIVPVRRRSEGRAEQRPEGRAGQRAEGRAGQRAEGRDEGRATRTAVLKVSFPHPGNVHEPDAYAAWEGRGAVLLHERHDERFAMLLERARTSTLAEVEDGDEVVAVAGRINRRLAIPAPPGLPRLRDQADAWEARLHKDAGELTHTLSPYVVGAAVVTVRELGRVQPDTLIHGDLHPGNILHADREPWLAVDPKGYAGDPAYDAGTLLKSRALTLLEADDLRKALHRMLDVFAEAAELDRQRTRRWAQFHAVQAAFWGRRNGSRTPQGESQPDWLTTFAEHMAELLTERT